MTTPTNWPDPERPGVPMFPEQDGWHMTTHSGATSPTVSFWCASEEVWKSGASSYPPNYLAHPMRKYIGPILTPTQITELLAGERERCVESFSVHGERAKLCWNDATSDEEKQYWRGALNTFEECCDEIRNLGDAS